MKNQRFIDAKEARLNTIFSNIQEAYRIPIYQRPYSWRQEQWENLLEDITSLENDKIHFLGSIVVVPEEEHRFGINYFQIVDGQQRLATILIWLAVIRDLAKEKRHEGPAGLIDQLLFVTDFVNDKKIPKLQLGKFERGKSDDDALQVVLKGLPKEFEHLIFDCYQYFHEKTKDINIYQKILYNVVLVHINAFSHLNAFRLFETLNDRGLELSAADLLKNYLLMRVASDEKIFEKIIEEWLEMYEKIRKYESVKFIRRYILSEWAGKISESKLYEEISEKLNTKSIDEIYGLVKSLNRAATIYQKIFEKSFTSERINRKLSELHLIEVSPSFTLLLKIIPFWLDRQIHENELFDIMEMIEVFHLRWGICDQATSRLDRIYNEICQKLKNQLTEKFKEIIKQILFDEIKSNVDDEIFLRSFLSRKFKSSEPRTKYILWKLSDPTGETRPNIERIQTDHIMPRKLTDRWIRYLEEKAMKNREEILALHKDYLNKIGNLTIIKDNWNFSISNKLFSEKKDEYKNSEFQITKELYSYSSWTFSEIDKRTDLFAQKALRIWRWRW